MTNALSFDYVIIGAGAAGCALANKLSQDPNITVCLLEAGPPDRHIMIKIPAGFTKMVGLKKYTWGFQSEPEAQTGNRQIPLVQGRTLGGSTSINGMIYIRGQKKDYDGWEAKGNIGWGYESILPYLKSLENRPSGDPAYAGTAGPVNVTEVSWRDPICSAFIEAANESGLPLNHDYNGKQQFGVAYAQTTVFRRRRVSAASAFLRPALRRKNLRVVANAVSDRILFNNKQASGVSYIRHGQTYTVHAREEVIIAAGTVNTARLLQVSGVGDPELLGELGVPVVSALKGVGKNLQDHYLCTAVASGRNFQSLNQMAHGVQILGQVGRYVTGRSSILELVPPLVHWFAKSGLSQPEEDADIEGVFTPASINFDKQGALDRGAGMTLGFWQHRPLSRGYVKAISTNVSDHPIVQPNYLAHEFDRASVVAGYKWVRSFLRSEALSPFVLQERDPGAGLDTDESLLDFARRTGGTARHFVGTAKMGPETDEMSVVDPNLCVHGTSRLRVADASIMPDIVSANTQVTAMMIGLKAADLILEARKRRNWHSGAERP